jgi:3-hydroxybutyryl-CoA dehydrogenase
MSAARSDIVAVLGAGTMGHGIAHVAAAAGYVVRLFDVAPAAVDRGLDQIRKNLDKGVEKKKLTAEDRDLALARIEKHSDLDKVAIGASWVVEAAPEKIEVKREIFAKLGASSSRSAILGSNTSSLSVSEIARGVPSPERVIGLHFFNPPHLMQLLEIVRGNETSDETVQRSRDFAVTLGKTPIVVRDSPGFATSRLGIALGMEAIRMLEDGVASAEDIDKAMELGYNHPIGPLKLTDVVGLDVRMAIGDYLASALNQPQFRPPELLRKMVAEGKLGKKSGQGFYKW